MTSSQQQVLVLRDGEGNFYLIDGNSIQNARVPADKAQALEKALEESQDTAGFFFKGPTFTSIVDLSKTANVGQSNVQSGANVIAGSIAGFAPQTLNQTGINVAEVKQ